MVVSEPNGSTESLGDRFQGSSIVSAHQSQRRDLSTSMEYTPLGVYSKPTICQRSLALTGRSVNDVETYLRHRGLLVVFLGHEEFGFANLMEW